MKPCPQNRKLMVWLTLDALDALQAKQLRTHLASCPGCRAYLAEISSVTEKLAAAEPLPDLQASERFHRQLAGKLRSTRRDSFWQTVIIQFQSLTLIRRMAVPASLAILLVLGGLGILRSSRAPIITRPAPPKAMLVLEAGQDLTPTIANYQRVANESLDKLDALLTRQGNQSPPQTPSYTASTRALTQASF